MQKAPWAQGRGGLILSGSTEKAQFEKMDRCASGEFGRWGCMEVPVRMGIPDQRSSAAKIQERDNPAFRGNLKPGCKSAREWRVQ